MSNPSKEKGDRFEWDTIKWAEQFLADVASLLTVERTRAGYERDYGDLLVRTPDDRTLAALQLKNRREWNISAWCDAAQWQGERARARFAALLVKRTRVADCGRAYAIMPANVYLRLLALLYEAERDRDAARAELTMTELAAIEQVRP